MLIVQTDESDSNLKSKIRKMNIATPRAAFTLSSSSARGISPNCAAGFEPIRRGVLMDSPAAVSGTDISASEAGHYTICCEMAAEEGCAIVMTHHLRKPGKDKAARTTVGMADLYGNQYLTAASTDVWGITKDPESDQANPQFVLKVLKPRSSVTQSGDEFRLSGNLEDLSFELASLNGDEKGIQKLNSVQKMVLKAVQGRTVETALRKDELVTHTGQSESSVRRVLDSLVSAELLQKAKRASDGGRPAYVYWGV